MALYESTIILRPDLTQADVEKVSEGFEAIVAEAKGKVVKKEFWGLRDLTYKIHKSKKGHYVHFGLDTPSEAIDELRRKFKISEDVLRDLTIKVDSISKEAGNDNFDDRK